MYINMKNKTRQSSPSGGSQFVFWLWEGFHHHFCTVFIKTVTVYATVSL